MPASDSPPASYHAHPLLVVTRGNVGPSDLKPLLTDSRFAAIVNDQLTPELVALGNRSAVVIFSGGDSPLEALTYGLSHGLRGRIALVVDDQYKRMRTASIAAGAMELFTMPIARADVDMLCRLLSREGSVARADVTLHLILDPIARVARYRDKSVHLTQREFALLFRLSMGQGQPISAEDILIDVWADRKGGNTSRQILDVYVHQLRRKLSDLGFPHGIATVRSYGYALNAASGGAL